MVVQPEEEVVVDNGGNADDGTTCMDAGYGDGTCHIDLACGIPDIDCFVQFSTDDEARMAVSALVPTAPTGDSHYAAAHVNSEAEHGVANFIQDGF